METKEILSALLEQIISTNRSMIGQCRFATVENSRNGGASYSLQCAGSSIHPCLNKDCHRKHPKLRPGNHNTTDKKEEMSKDKDNDN